MGFNLKEQLVFYGAYHRDPTNVKIHMACVPILLTTGFLFLPTSLPQTDLETSRPRSLSNLNLSHWISQANAYLQGTNTPSFRTPPSLQKLNLPLNLGTLAAILYSTLYIILSPNFAGLSLAPLIISSASLVNKLKTRYSVAKANSIAVAIHVVSWILQFIGHGKYEGRKPALLDNLVQALFLAPLFVWYEALFKLGFYKQLQKDVERGIEEEMRRIKEAKK